LENLVYRVSKDGDWLEQKAADFIISSIPAYEIIWQNFIGNIGNATMAEIKGISHDDEKMRKDFSEHHYTILESLYFMQLIIDDETKTKEVNSFEDYRRVINQIMSFQAYAGRLRDNMEACYLSISNSYESKCATDSLEEFYHVRHVFIHGKKVPFGIDKDGLFKISQVKKNKLSNDGFGLESGWNDVTKDDLVYAEDLMKEAMEGLKPLVNNLLNRLYSSHLKGFMQKRGLMITPPASNNVSNHFSGTSGISGSNTVNFEDKNSGRHGSSGYYEI
jgi:hypothetical protein